MPCELYLIRLIHHHTRKAFPGERLWTATQLMSVTTVRFLRIRNREGCDVYIQPHATDRNAGYILVDLDHADAAVLDAMRADGHEPCVVVQTSPGNLQAWVHVIPGTLEPIVATAVGRHLAHRYGGDPASTDWRHLGRLAGFTNQKPERRRPGGWPPWVKIVHARPGLASGGLTLLEAAQQCSLPTPLGGTHRTGDTRAAIAGVEQLPRAAETYRAWVKRWRIAERFPQPDWSIVDLWIARELLARDTPVAAVKALLRLGSPNFPRRHSDPEDYLNRTLARAAFPVAPRRRPVCPTHARTSTPAAADNLRSNSAGGR